MQPSCAICLPDSAGRTT